jgi:hypothetical protein
MRTLTVRLLANGNDEPLGMVVPGFRTFSLERDGAQLLFCTGVHSNASEPYV